MGADKSARPDCCGAAIPLQATPAAVEEFSLSPRGARLRLVVFQTYQTMKPSSFIKCLLAGVIPGFFALGPATVRSETIVEESSGYRIMRVCEDSLVLHTSDGAEAGHISYMVFDPRGQRVVSFIASGGFLAERLVPVPVDSIRFGSNRQITLVDINRDQLINAPVIERTSITNVNVVESTVFERSTTHFRERSHRRDDGNPVASPESRARTDAERTRDREPDRTSPSGTARPNAERERESNRKPDKASPDKERESDANRTPGTARPDGSKPSIGGKRDEGTDKNTASRARNEVENKKGPDKTDKNAPKARDDGAGTPPHKKGENPDSPPEPKAKTGRPTDEPSGGGPATNKEREGKGPPPAQQKQEEKAHEKKPEKAEHTGEGKSKSGEKPSAERASDLEKKGAPKQGKPDPEERKPGN